MTGPDLHYSHLSVFIASSILTDPDQIDHFHCACHAIFPINDRADQAQRVNSNFC